MSFLQGFVGISLNCDWGEPVDINNPSDIEAAERYLQFCLGWFANPIYAGDYPQVMKDHIGEPSHVFVCNLFLHVCSNVCRCMCALVCIRVWEPGNMLLGWSSVVVTLSLSGVELAGCQ